MPVMNKNKTSRLLLTNLFFVALFLLGITPFTLAHHTGNGIKVSVSLKNYNGSDVSCYGAADAEITISATGGSGNYMYSIDQGKTFQKSNVFPNLAGEQNYIIVVKDDKGQLSDATWKWVSTVYNPVTISYVNTTSADCSANGKISAGAWGGSGKAKDIVFSIDNGATFQSSGDFDNLLAGEYILIAKDVNGCTSEFRQVTVTSKNGLGLVLTTQNSNADGQSGKATVSGTGGKSPYTYQLDKKAFSTNGNFTNLSGGNHQVTVKDANGCLFTKIFSIQIDNAPLRKTWTGAANTDWNNGANWNDGKAPVQKDNVWIVSTANMPEIKSTGYVNDITLDGAAKLTISSVLNISGSISAANGSINALNGTILVNGVSEQVLTGDVFTNNALMNLVINNNTTLKSALDIYGRIDFSGNSRTLTTNDLLTLKSTATQTAAVGNQGTNLIRGKVTVEKYIPAVKGWKFLSVATTGSQTIHDAWQEGEAASVTSLKGKGTQITGEMSDWSAKGFDMQSPSPSVKTYNSQYDTWVGLSATNQPFSNASNAYMTFVRGDRNSIDRYAPVTETVLRSKGELRSGDQNTVKVDAGLFIPVGNPFASDIDLSKIKTDRPMFFYYWDQNLGRNYGAYQTLVLMPGGRVEAVPGKGSFTSRNSNVIPSGEAFFAYNQWGGTLQITEDAKLGAGKISTTQREMGTAGTTGTTDFLKLSLYSVNSDGSLTPNDGIMQAFSPEFNKGVDEQDGLKYSNTGENISIKKGGKLLSFESMPFNSSNDTTVLNLTGISYITYEFEITFNQESSAKQAYLVDRYTKTSTPIDFNRTTRYRFSVINDAVAKSADRFMIVFRQMSPQPVTITSVSVVKKQQNAEITWKVENEKNVAKYQVEKSANGSDFQVAGIAKANGSSSYSFTDMKTWSGVNYYRIVSVDMDGKRNVSNVVKVQMDNVLETYSIFPNPVVGNTIHVEMNTELTGSYYFSITNQIGQTVGTYQMQNTGMHNKVDIEKKDLAKGIYTLEVVNPKGERSVLRFIK